MSLVVGEEAFVFTFPHGRQNLDDLPLRILVVAVEQRAPQQGFAFLVVRDRHPARRPGGRTHARQATGLRTAVEQAPAPSNRRLQEKTTPANPLSGYHRIGRTKMRHSLRELYESTEEDMTFGVGLIQLPDAEPAPYIHVFYQDWSREKLEVVSESSKSGLILVSAERKPGLHHLYIGTRETIALQQTEGEHTSVLKAPAWDTHLADVEGQAFRQFEINRKRHGGFLLLLQTPEWEFLTAVEDPDDQTVVGPIQERSLPIPSGNP